MQAKFGFRSARHAGVISGEAVNPGYAVEPSIDTVRVIRRSMRCFVLGALGLVPGFGFGLALLALGVHRLVRAELNERFSPPPVAGYLLVGGVGVAFLDPRIGLGGDLFLLIVLLGIQSWHVLRRFRQVEVRQWNPGGRALLGGVVFAYAGLNLTLWGAVVAASRFPRMVSPT